MKQGNGYARVVIRSKEGGAAIGGITVYADEERDRVSTGEIRGEKMDVCRHWRR